MHTDALFILNRSAATGHTNEDTAALLRTYERHFAFARRRVCVVTSHPAACAAASAFQSSYDGFGVVVSGGGAGTLRAIVEGLCARRQCPPEPDRLCVAPLRLGSGNVLAKTFGVSSNADVALSVAAHHVAQRRILSCSVMRCDVDGTARFATTLIGLGQFGRIPRDLTLWHRNFPRMHRWIATALGVERLTQVEYRVLTAVRSLLCSILPDLMERVEVETTEGRSHVRLFAGAVANFPIPGLPFTPPHGPGVPALSGFLLRSAAVSPIGLLRRRSEGVAIRFIVGTDEPVTIRLLSSTPAPFFLDEDPMSFRRELRIGIAGTLGIVPGLVSNEQQFQDSANNHSESEVHHGTARVHTRN